MKHQAIVSDFDGTLVDKTHTISPKVKTAIKKYLNHGGIFSIATGRDYYGVLKSICLDLGLNSYHIVRGGSEIISGKTHEVVWAKYIPQGIVKKLLSFLKKQEGIYFAAERGELIYTKAAKPKKSFGPDAQYGNLDEMPHDSVPKVFLPPRHNKTKPILKIHQHLERQFPQLNIIRTGVDGGVGIDITDGGASKHIALLEYAKLLNIDPKHIVGIGDSYNDYPLLSACGLKVAMGNAPQELLEIADHVVSTQQEDGVAEAIQIALKK